MKTFREIIDENNSKEVEFTVNLIDFTGKGLTITASCWTDDPDMLDHPALFSIDASWQRYGGVGQYDNLHGELDTAIMALINLIAAKFGGEWQYHATDCTIKQKDA